jgi:hypothetical protein
VQTKKPPFGGFLFLAYRIDYEPHDTDGGDHDEESDNPPNHMFLSYILLFLIIRIRQEFDYTEDENQKCNCKQDSYQWIDDFFVNCCHYCGSISICNTWKHNDLNTKLVD